MIEQLLLSKRLFQEGEKYSLQNDPISAGLAISLFQDSVESIIWLVTKELGIDVKENESFTSLLNKVHQELENKLSIKLPLQAKILELNKARVNFKHYGILPDISQANKFRGYAENYLITIVELYFKNNFDDISMSELIRSDEVRSLIKQAEKNLNIKDYNACVAEIARAKAILFYKIRFLIPEVDKNIVNVASFFDRQSSSHVRNVFQYMSDYMNRLREISIINLCGVSVKEYNHFIKVLPYAVVLGDGNFQITHKFNNNFTEQDAKFLLKFIIDLALKIQSVS
ncbi:hypothetical protein [Nostoc parmelioides]|uniref:HEPN domain-containing protein n=1 Tax=Nostoc parmelioides FACHB-3921 TaxID=2692909 RepID=A0ABR8BNC4_9NOSO|nr:hypothetical protein [Nostoc parmelioides]MBD2254453.1 hypothetical protein [Nostoc parmelioides FACHB-3921]